LEGVRAILERFFILCGNLVDSLKGKLANIHTENNMTVPSGMHL
jgi:hypothetical protein